MAAALILSPAAAHADGPPPLTPEVRQLYKASNSMSALVFQPIHSQDFTDQKLLEK